MLNGQYEKKTAKNIHAPDLANRSVNENGRLINQLLDYKADSCVQDECIMLYILKIITYRVAFIRGA